MSQKEKSLVGRQRCARSRERERERGQRGRGQKKTKKKEVRRKESKPVGFSSLSKCYLSQKGKSKVARQRLCQK